MMKKKIFLVSFCMVYGMSAGIDARGKTFIDDIIVINDSKKDIAIKGKVVAKGETAVIKTDASGMLAIEVMHILPFKFTIPYEPYTKAVLPVTPEHHSLTYVVDDGLFANIQKQTAEEIIKAQRKFESEFTREVYELKKDKRIREISAEIAELGKIDAPEAEGEIIELVKEKYCLLKQTYEDMLKKARRDINTLIAGTGLAMGDLEKDLLS